MFREAPALSIGPADRVEYRRSNVVPGKTIHGNLHIGDVGAVEDAVELTGPGQMPVQSWFIVDVTPAKPRVKCADLASRTAHDQWHTKDRLVPGPVSQGLADTG